MAPTVPIEFVGQKESKKCWLLQPMAKSRRNFQRHSSGFVPEYSRGIEAMGESEGFGGLGRFYSEMTASEDSCAPKMKCINLNVNGYDSLCIPVQVLSLSKMSRSERKDLQTRLKMELEQVRVLQSKVTATLSSNLVLLSPSSDIHSCSDGHKRPPLDDLYRSFEASALHGKKRAPSGRNGTHTKKGTSGHIEPMKSAAPVGTSKDILMKQCETLLQRLMTHQFSWVFNEPVDAVKLNIPDYHTIIKQPMDFGTVKSRMASGEYSSPVGFAADVRLTFSNALKYNPPGNDFHNMAKTLSKYFEVRWKAIEKKLPETINVELAPPAPGQADMDATVGMPLAKRKRISPDDNKIEVDPVRQVMSDEEKHKLSIELEALLGELPESIFDFLKEHRYNDGQTSEEEIEIDIDSLSDDTLFKLRKLLDDFLLQNQKNQSKAEQCEIEILNTSGFSNSSPQPCKGNDSVDEDIDIVGGNDPATANYPLADMKKEAGHKDSKCGSSSSSSGESGSSSSGSYNL
uniref:Bromodomain-containing protein n=1 Tax=Rhizophora mucronata TaxID=61149 RepID=A0A2P2KL44_RHIMU